MDIYFDGTVENGKVKLNNREQFDDFILQFEGQQIQACVRKYDRSRTIPQNRYLRGVVVPIVAKEMGEANHDAVHEHLINEFGIEVVSDTGITYKKRTSDYSTMEIKEYVRRIQTFYADEGLIIPDPESVDV